MTFCNFGHASLPALVPSDAHKSDWIADGETRRGIGFACVRELHDFIVD